MVTATSASKDADVALAKWTRVAVVSCGETKPTAGSTTGTLTWLFENSVSETGATKEKYVSGFDSDKSELTLGDVNANKHVVGAFSTITSASTTDTKGYLTDLASGKNCYYMISVWMEGTEMTNQDLADTGSVDVTLGFSGIDA